MVPEFAVEDLPLDRTATLVPAFEVKDPHLMMMMMVMVMYYNIIITSFNYDYNLLQYF